MQQVGRVLPLNGYLHRIKRHPTGDCPWCPGQRETQLHFHCECNCFEQHRTAAHHLIARAVISALKESTKGWQFHYEKTFADLPWVFKWKTYGEKRKQLKQRPDGVAWHAEKQLLYFLEFSRPMDQDDTMAAASARKGRQYDEAVEAVIRGQGTAEGRANKVWSVATLPLMFGVRGSVEYAELKQAMAVFGARSLDKVLAAGVRATVEAATTMIGARRAALTEEGGASGSEGRARRRRIGRRRSRQQGRNAGAADGATS